MAKAIPIDFKYLKVVSFPVEGCKSLVKVEKPETILPMLLGSLKKSILSGKGSPQ